MASVELPRMSFDSPKSRPRLELKRKIYAAAPKEQLFEELTEQKPRTANGCSRVTMKQGIGGGLIQSVTKRQERD